jgi:hypothetical protein
LRLTVEKERVKRLKSARMGGMSRGGEERGVEEECGSGKEEGGLMGVLLETR